MASTQTRVIGPGTDADFSYPEHTADWLVIGGTAETVVTVCRVCGKVEVEPVNDLGGQDPAPRFGADEHLTW